MEIKILEATVLLTDGADDIVLKTSLPCPYVREFLPSQPPLDFRFSATYDTGIEYCRKNLNIEPEVINIRRK